MPQEIVIGKITKINDDGTVTISAQLPSIDRAVVRRYEDVLVGFADGRSISPQQRGYIYSIISAIAEYIDGISNSETIEDAKRFLKMEFVLHHMQGMERRMFSLSDVDMNTASDFISFLIEFVLANDIPVRFPLYEKAEDIEHYVYACLVHKKCAVCGRKADLHHAEGSRIGAGFNRNDVHHLGREALPLCREHHTLLHTMPEAEFLAKYHLEPVKIDERICKLYGLKK